MKKIFLALLLTVSFAQASFAVELPDVMKQSMAQDPLGVPAMVNLVVSMIVVIALIYVTGWIYAKLNVVNKDKLTKINGSNKDNQRFTVLQSMPLGQQRHLYSIEMGDKILLVGSTPSHINLIKEFDKKNSTEENAVLDDENDEVSKEINIDELYKKYKN